MSEASPYPNSFLASAWSVYHSHQSHQNRVSWAWSLNSYFQNFPKQPDLESTENSQEWQKKWRAKRWETREQRSSGWKGLAVSLCLSAAGNWHFSASAFSHLSTNYWKEWGGAGWTSVFWSQTQWGQTAWLFMTGVNYLNSLIFSFLINSTH